MRRFVSLAAVTSIAIALASASGGCSAKKNTELMLAVQTDVKVPKDLNGVTVRILSFGAVQFENFYAVGPDGLKLPATIGVVPQNVDDLKPIDVEIIGHFVTPGTNEKDPKTEKVIRKSRVTFAKGVVSLMRMPLRFACFDSAKCGDGMTCIGGVCSKTPEIEGASLPIYVPEEFNPQAAGEDATRGCFDAEKCLASAKPLTAPGDTCVFDLGEGVPEKGVTLWMRKSGADGYGFCSDGQCSVPIDRDANEGWDYDGEARNRVRLAQGLCAKLKSGFTLAVTTTCGEKNANRPFCEAAAPTPPSGDMAAACRAQAAAKCDRLESCVPIRMALGYASKSECNKYYERYCALVGTLPGVTVDSASACADFWRASTCDELVAFAAASLGHLGCPPGGTLADGSACLLGDQCAGKACRLGDAACGTCVRARAVGESCTAASEGAPCEVGASCVAGRCEKRPRETEGCATATCVTGTHCSAEKICVRNGRDGESCSATQPCDTDVRYLYCSASICTAVTVLEPGAPCDTAKFSTERCGKGSTCTSGKCTLPLPLGAACSTDGSGPRCESFSGCTSGTCTDSKLPSCG